MADQPSTPTDPTTPDSRDLNPPLPKSEADDKQKVALRLADGSVKAKTAGELDKKGFGDLSTGPSVADLNPGFYATADTGEANGEPADGTA